MLLGLLVYVYGVWKEVMFESNIYELWQSSKTWLYRGFLLCWWLNLSDIYCLNRLAQVLVECLVQFMASIQVYIVPLSLESMWLFVQLS